MTMVIYLAREIYEMLQKEGHQTIRQIHRRYIHAWSASTIRKALRELRNDELVERIPNILDMRQGVYRIKKADKDVSRVYAPEDLLIEVE